MGLLHTCHVIQDQQAIRMATPSLSSSSTPAHSHAHTSSSTPARTHMHTCTHTSSSIKPHHCRRIQSISPSCGLQHLLYHIYMVGHILHNAIICGLLRIFAFVYLCVCVCVCVRARACVRACAHVCVCMVCV